MTQSVPLDVDHLRSWIGLEESATEGVSIELVRKYRATFDMPSVDVKPGDIAPRLIHLCLTAPVAPMSRLGRDGHPTRGGFLPPVPLPRRMWAGGSFAFEGDIRVGDEVRRTSRIEDVVVKEGRSGRLCFVTVAHRIEANGIIVVNERQDIVYRGDEPQTRLKKPTLPAEPGRHRRAITASPTLLFRYSALTFNGHRIHYDRDYATGVEGYAGLVVHGPLQAAMLYYFASDVLGQPPGEFAFRGQSPVFDGEELFLNAQEDGDKLSLWTCRDGGPIGMSAGAL